MADKNFKLIVVNALAEDIGAGDITSQLCIPAGVLARAQFVAREPMVVAGLAVISEVYGQLGGAVAVSLLTKDGQAVAKGAVLADISGPARAILTGERVALNLLQRACGVATMTRRYVDAAQGTKAVILDTRKTMPGLRVLDKYAVTCGGGKNHRMRLDDMVLIKDNHIAINGQPIAALVKSVRDQMASDPEIDSPVPIVVECDTLEQVRDALAAKPDRILLDNMSLDQLREAVALSAGAVPLEASGGVNLETVRGIAETGVDCISVGAITHSAPNVDIALDVIF